MCTGAKGRAQRSLGAGGRHRAAQRDLRISRASIAAPSVRCVAGAWLTSDAAKGRTTPALMVTPVHWRCMEAFGWTCARDQRRTACSGPPSSPSRSKGRAWRAPGFPARWRLALQLAALEADQRCHHHQVAPHHDQDQVTPRRRGDEQGVARPTAAEARGDERSWLEHAHPAAPHAVTRQAVAADLVDRAQGADLEAAPSEPTTPASQAAPKEATLTTPEAIADAGCARAAVRAARLPRSLNS